MNCVSRGEIYYANLNPVTGSEQGGERPVLILQNDEGNRYSPTTIVAAITGNCMKANLPTHVTLPADVLHRESVVLLEQVRTIDKRRLGDYIGKLGKAAMTQIDHALATSFGMEFGMEQCL